MNFFDNGAGVTADSLAYYREQRHQLGTVVAAEVSFPGLSDHYPYCFELRDDRVNRMFLSGLTAGYPGEGPRAAMEVLADAGFPPPTRNESCTTGKLSSANPYGHPTRRYRRCITDYTSELFAARDESDE